MRGAVRRVTFQDEAVCLDGQLLPVPPQGKDMSTHGALPPPTSPVVKAMQPLQAPESPRARRPSAISSISSGRTSARPRNIDGALAPLPPPSKAPVLDEPALIYQPQLATSSSLQQLVSQPSAFKGNSVLSVADYERSDLHLLFTVAQEMRVRVQREALDLLRGRVLCSLFYEPSTRTSASFDAAMKYLGGNTVVVSVAHSSVQKGETLQDTLRTLGQYGNAVVLRHPDERSMDVARRTSPVPVINAGNGSKEHPTQAFLDLFTIREELGTVQGLTITFVGDLLYGRTVHSLCNLLKHYQVQIQLVAPKALALPSKLRDELVARGQLLGEFESLTRDIVARSDVLYCTRVQQERFPSAHEYEKVKGSYRIDNATLRYAKANMIVMHPLPRNEEIAEEVDFDERAAYYRQVCSAMTELSLWIPWLTVSTQMKYGLWCRMALLALVMSP